MKEEPQNPSIDPELEARIVALVLGEASDFECDELNRLMEERPELAEFKDMIRGTHGLLQDVATGRREGSAKRAGVARGRGCSKRRNTGETRAERALPEARLPGLRPRSLRGRRPRTPGPPTKSAA